MGYLHGPNWNNGVQNVQVYYSALGKDFQNLEVSTSRFFVGQSESK
jgi:hypothetical protein